MQKSFIGIFLLLCTMACVIFPQQASFEEKAGTQVSLALTSTALDAIVSQLEQTTVPPAEIEPTETSTQQSKTDPKADLGDPAYTDTCSSWSEWSVESENQVLEEITTISVSDGKLSMQSSQVGKFHWWFNYREIKDAYLEAVFETGNCSGSDQYGLVFRAPDYFNGVGYYFTLTCDGKYDLREKDDPDSLIQDNQLRFGMKDTTHLNTGSNQKNILGIWMKGETIRLYLNNQFIDEITDARLTGAGHFGLFIYARKTPGFKISLDEISYWDIE